MRRLIACLFAAVALLPASAAAQSYRTLGLVDGKAGVAVEELTVSRVMHLASANFITIYDPPIGPVAAEIAKIDVNCHDRSYRLSNGVFYNQYWFKTADEWKPRSGRASGQAMGLLADFLCDKQTQAGFQSSIYSGRDGAALAIRNRLRGL